MILKKLYIKGFIYPSLIAIVSTGVLSVLENSNYKSEWLTKESVIGMSCLAAVVYSFIICVLGLTVFMNQTFIKTKGTASFLSWFLLPVSFITIAVSKTIYHRLHYDPGSTGQLVYLITLNVPFIVGLVWTYILFLKTNETRSSVIDN